MLPRSFRQWAFFNVPQRWRSRGDLALSGLARMRCDSDGLARDLAEARRLFAQMGVTGWDDYARWIAA
jgi:hypothetical protein